jgi:hypothetical protein
MNGWARGFDKLQCQFLPFDKLRANGSGILKTGFGKILTTFQRNLIIQKDTDIA